MSHFSESERPPSWRDAEWVVEQFEAGHSPLEIARATGDWYTLVARTLREEGYDPGDPPWSDEDTLRDLYEDRGWSTDRIACHLKTNPASIRVSLRKFGYDRVVSKSRLREMMRDKQMTYEEIADELDCSVQSVYRYRKRYDIQ